MAESAASARRRRTAKDGRTTLRDEQRKLTRQRLADAAIAVFEEIGYGAASADAIAKRAGANRATFYLHYASKVDVALDLMDRVDEEVMAIFAAANALEAPSRADVRAWLDVVVAFWRRYRGLIDASQQAMPVEQRAADRWWDGFERMVDAMPRLLAGLDGEERLRERIRIQGALLELERFCYYLFIAGVALDRDRVMEVLTDRWHALLRADGHPPTRPAVTAPPPDRGHHEAYGDGMGRM
jgi:AcrR family transcriptional regulator